MPVPFAIMLPAVIYLLLQGGIPALNQPWPGELGQHEMCSRSRRCRCYVHGGDPERKRIEHTDLRRLAKLVARLPGGLLQPISPAARSSLQSTARASRPAATIGGVALPQLLSRGYNRPLAAGSLAAGGTLGILIPAELPMIIYGTFTETSVPKLFIAGVIPGLIMTALFMVYIALHAKLDPSVAPREFGAGIGARIPARARQCRALRPADVRHPRRLYSAWSPRPKRPWSGASCRFVLGVTMGTLALPGFLQAIYNTITFSGNILFLILAAYIFSPRSALRDWGNRSPTTSSA